MKDSGVFPFLTAQRTVLILWLFLTAFNLNKAYHIDDTFHLEAAEWIAKNPGKPMSGEIIWGSLPVPMYERNQPPLFFFLMAGIGSIFGYSEVIMHLLLSVFTLGTLWFFYKLTCELEIKENRYLLLLFGLCPALLVNQNLMVDVPVLSLLLASTFFAFRWVRDNQSRFIVYSLVCLSAGFFMKYSLLPVFFALGLFVLTRKKYRPMLFFIIPLGLFALWCWWNYSEYGSCHFFDRPSNELQIWQLWPLLSCLGAMVPFWIPSLFSKNQKTVSIVIIAVFLLLFAFSFVSSIDLNLKQWIHDLVFVLFGSLLAFSLLKKGLAKLKTDTITLFTSKEGLLWHILLFLGVFITLFAPFIATRHLLLLIPFMLLLSWKPLVSASSFAKGTALVGGFILTIGLGISDWQYADYYRDMAKELGHKHSENTRFIGHWGWMHYAKESGFKQYSLTDSTIQNGTLVLKPRGITDQRIQDHHHLVHKDTYEEAPNWSTLFNGNQNASLYYNTFGKPAWLFAFTARDTVDLFEVKEIEPVRR